MSNGIYKINSPDEYPKAGSTDLIELLPAPDRNSLFIPKIVLETLASAIAHGEFIHLSGPTGSAKSALIEALEAEPANFLAICAQLGLEPRPLKLYAIEMATYETPSELWGRRSLKNNQTYDEPSRLVKALAAAAQDKDCYPLIWLREMGRVMSATIQGGLLNLMTKADILLPDGERINARAVAWVADSNYQAEKECVHTLVTLDDALKRRFTVNITLDYLAPVQEAYALTYIVGREYGKSKIDLELIKQVVRLGLEIRTHRLEGTLQSVAPPTIYGYLSFLRMAMFMPHLSRQQVASMTLLGAAGRDEEKYVSAILGKVFGVQGGTTDQAAVPGNVI